MSHSCRTQSAHLSQHLDSSSQVAWAALHFWALGWSKRMKNSHNLHIPSCHTVVSLSVFWDTDVLLLLLLSNILIINYTLDQENADGAGNFIISQMVKRTARCWGVREEAMVNRTYAVCKRWWWGGVFCFNQLIGFYGACWAEEHGTGASGLHLKPLCWAIKKKMRRTSSSWEEFVAKQQRFSPLVNINGAAITSGADINLAKWLTETVVTQG